MDPERLADRGVLTAGSGQTYDINYNYQNNGGNVNLTGLAGLRRTGCLQRRSGAAPGDGYRQFNTAAGPDRPTEPRPRDAHHAGMPEQDRRPLVVADIRINGSQGLEFRLDVFNALNTVVIDNRQNEIQFVSPTNLTIRNSQTLADGSVDPTRLTPRTAGFGAATRALDMRTMQVQVRYRF
jgi:hypothetical protein